MARHPSAYRAVHDAADSLEPLCARAVVSGIEHGRRAVSINRLGNALAARDIKAAMRILSPAVEKDLLGAAATIVRAAVMRGGRIGVDQARKAALVS